MWWGQNVVGQNVVRSICGGVKMVRSSCGGAKMWWVERVVGSRCGEGVWGQDVVGSICGQMWWGQDVVGDGDGRDKLWGQDVVGSRCGRDKLWWGQDVVGLREWCGQDLVGSRCGGVNMWWGLDVGWSRCGGVNMWWGENVVGTSCGGVKMWWGQESGGVNMWWGQESGGVNMWWGQESAHGDDVSSLNVLATVPAPRQHRVTPLPKVTFEAPCSSGRPFFTLDFQLEELRCLLDKLRQDGGGGHAVWSQRGCGGETGVCHRSYSPFMLARRSQPSERTSCHWRVVL
ncbi:hypothetical protein Hamer_G014464 [Homarus americanus]|uniref:Uncharacterized protein n=1 Tax=Homarus americanus TaxID=6706 RepID=A0A8J5MTP5_HOMAM|nr:hypothetical protein Hamer_G014464 [Homarus americanus]